MNRDRKPPRDVASPYKYNEEDYEIGKTLEHLLQYKNKIRDAVLVYDAQHFDSGAGYSTLQRVDELYEMIESVIENLRRRKEL